MQLVASLIGEGKTEMVHAQPGILLSNLLENHGHPIDMPCGGKGTCRRCRVIATGELSPLTPVEQKAFTPEELANGLRLACVTRAMGNVTVQPEITSVFDSIVTQGQQRDFPIQPYYKNWGVAIDIGTTTLSAQLFSPKGMAYAISKKKPPIRFRG